MRYYDGTIESLYDSPVWGPDRMGGGINSHGEVDGDNPYYVTDGKFANIPITQTQEPEHWCKDLMELSGQVAYDDCVETLNGVTFQTGITIVRPMPDDHLHYVNRRPMHFMDTDYCQRRAA